MNHVPLVCFSLGMFGALVLCGCGPALVRNEAFSPKRVQEMQFADTCKLQEYFDGDPAPYSSDDESLVSGTRRGKQIGRITFKLEPGPQTQTLLQLLRTYYTRLPSLDTPGPLHATVSFIATEVNGKESRQIPIGAEVQLEADHRETTLPYHPCLSFYFFGKSTFEMRRRLLGLPSPARQKTALVLLEELKGKDPEARKNTMVELRKRGPSLLPDLLKALENPEVTYRQRLLELLPEMGAKALPAVPALFDMLASVQEDLQTSAAITLLEVIPALRAALLDPDPVLRTNAATALAKMEVQSPIPVLLRAVKRQSSSMRQVSWAALSKAGAMASAALIKALHDPDSAIRLQAAIALGELGRILDEKLVDPEAVESALRTALKDPDVEVKNAAAKALTHVQRAPTPGTPAE
jgi:hypothetical protein